MIFFPKTYRLKNLEFEFVKLSINCTECLNCTQFCQLCHKFWFILGKSSKLITNAVSPLDATKKYKFYMYSTRNYNQGNHLIFYQGRLRNPAWEKYFFPFIVYIFLDLNCSLTLCETLSWFTVPRSAEISDFKASMAPMFINLPLLNGSLPFWGQFQPNQISNQFHN